MYLLQTKSKKHLFILSDYKKLILCSESSNEGSDHSVGFGIARLKATSTMSHTFRLPFSHDVFVLCRQTIFLQDSQGPVNKNSNDQIQVVIVATYVTT